MKKKMKALCKRAVGVALAAVLCGGITACGIGSQGGGTVAVKDLKKGNVSYEISCHDPQVIFADGSYVMCGSHQVIAESKDLGSWEYVANGNNMFTNIFKGELDAFKFVGKNEEGGYSIWASNIFYNDVMKKYIMYFCTSSTYIRSSLCMAVADEAKGPYTFKKAFLHSGFTKSDADQSNLYQVLGKDADISGYLEYGGYNNKLWPNCIDPAVFTDKDGRQWMVYGSWSGGLFLLELDPKTGLPIHPDAGSASAAAGGGKAAADTDMSAAAGGGKAAADTDMSAAAGGGSSTGRAVDSYFGYHLLGGGHHPIEGPYIYYNKETDYYYLFASYGELKRDGGYQIRQFRSKEPTGPYVDYEGKAPGDGDDYYDHGIKMAGNYKFPSLKTAYMAPGGQSVFEGKDGSGLYITYHQRFDDGTEYHEPRVHRLYLNEDGWYVMAPFETGSETQPEDGYRSDDISGTYYLLDHGLEVGSKIREAAECEFSDGKVTGTENEISYKVSEGSDRIQMKVGDTLYQGVIIDMNDEAGNPVRCIMAAGEDEHSIWAVQYRREK